MILLLRTIAYLAHDLVVAVYDLVIGRQRRQYRYELVVQAPKEVVRRFLTASHVTYEMGNIRIVTEPLAGAEGVDVIRYFVGDRPYGSICVRRTEPRPDSFSSRLLPELSELSMQIGIDDTTEVSLDVLSDGSTKMDCTRTLTHRRAGTRVSAPIGLRQFAWIFKHQAEKEVGHAAPWSRVAQSFWLVAAIGILWWLFGLEPAVIATLVFVAPYAAQWSRVGRSLWLIAAIGIFWGLFGWADAAILILVIIALELGHAAALLVTGRGARFFAGIPFFGGMVLPKYPYENECQRAFVSLTGPSLSLIPTLGFAWVAFSSHSVLAGRAAFWFAVFNCFNLLPVVPLDGGTVVDVLRRSMRDRLIPVIALLAVAAGLGLVLYNPFGWAVFVGLVITAAGLKFVFQSKLSKSAHPTDVGGRAAAALFATLALLLSVYWTVAWELSPSTRVSPGFQGSTHQASWHGTF
jgi:hypothetical protein